MLTLLMMILFFAVFGKLLGFAIRLGWGMLKIVVYLVFLPAIVLMMILGGLVYVALPILIIAGVASFLTRA
ncbi:MAG: hypothetical protein K5886_09110 [Lachnospiraceae bacterium]|nr:hypothetical protein [Lachnospiraceae bacterium]